MGKTIALAASLSFMAALVTSNFALEAYSVDADNAQFAMLVETSPNY